MGSFRICHQFLKRNLVVLVKCDPISAAEDMEVNMLACTKRVSIATALTLGIALGVPLSVPAFSDPAPSNTAMQNRAAPSLRGGDLVRLRSGGPLMTVEGIKGDQVDCFWTDPSGQMNAQSFPIYVLQKS
jgi:uncharacterized protein YodC (DUF2158 family)